MNNLGPIPCNHKGPHPNSMRLGFGHCNECKADRPLWNFHLVPGTDNVRHGTGCRVCNPGGYRLRPSARTKTGRRNNPRKELVSQ